MECPDCGSTEWRPHGSYRTADGRRVRRLRCVTEGCGRTRSERAGRASFGLERGAQPVEAPELDGREVSCYLRFLLMLRDRYALVGLPKATRDACDELGIARSTATRWLERSVRDGFPEEVVSEMLGWGLRAAVHLYGGQWPAPEPVRGETHRVKLGADPAPLGPSLRFARWLATVHRGDRLPSWLDRLWSSGIRTPAGSGLTNSWRFVERGVERFAEGRTPGTGDAYLSEDGPNATREPWDAHAASRWLTTRVFGRHGYRWRSRAHGALRRPDRMYHRMSSKTFLEAQLPASRSVQPNVTEAIEAWAREGRRRVDPSRLREDDLQLDRTLRYWVKTEPGQWKVVVATRRRVVGGTTYPDEAIDQESPWFRLRPERREEDPAAGTVVIPADGLDRPLVLGVSEDAVMAPAT